MYFSAKYDVVKVTSSSPEEYCAVFFIFMFIGTVFWYWQFSVMVIKSLLQWSKEDVDLVIILCQN